MKRTHSARSLRNPASRGLACGVEPTIRSHWVPSLNEIVETCGVKFKQRLWVTVGFQTEVAARTLAVRPKDPNPKSWIDGQCQLDNVLRAAILEMKHDAAAIRPKGCPGLQLLCITDTVPPESPSNPLGRQPDIRLRPDNRTISLTDGR